jgi:8-oxo-dGTP pyrophosphatase MutT (NUDIX family)
MDLKGHLSHTLAENPGRTLQIDGFRRAGVLVPLVERRDRVLVAFTLRSGDLPLHAGQISFPGGQPQEGDGDASGTALREAQEELGIDPAGVVLLGTLDDVATPTRFVITPVVGWLRDPAPFRACAREVEEFFEVPLEALRDPASFVYRGESAFAGRTYTLPEYHVEGRVVWGATARMVQTLVEHLAGFDTQP